MMAFLTAPLLRTLVALSRDLVLLDRPCYSLGIVNMIGTSFDGRMMARRRTAW